METKGKLLGWIVLADGGPIYLDKDGKWWRGGSTSLVWVVCFAKKEDAKKLRKRVMGRRIYRPSPSWAKIYPIYAKK